MKHTKKCLAGGVCNCAKELSETSKIAISDKIREENKMTNLQARLLKTIKEEKFDLLEISGFKVNPKLSLLAGALIGYRLAIRDSSKLLNPSLEDY